MCNLTEHDKATSAVLPVDRCPTDRRQKPWGEVSGRQEVLPPPTPPNTHKGLVLGGLLPSPKFRELLGIMISQVKFVFDNPPLHTHTHEIHPLPSQDIRALTLNSLLSHYCPSLAFPSLSPKQKQHFGVPSYQATPH